jgi:predicted AAA+ superfamily ATPase
MQYIPRLLAGPLKTAAAGFPVLIVTGPRRSGKTTLLRRAFPKASYHLLEDPDVIGRIRSDPRSFLEEVRLPAILDEIQNLPELLNYIRSRVDLEGKKASGWYLTGSQEPALMKGVTESMAGRAAVFQLLPFSFAESARVTLLLGGFPEVLARPKAADVWFRSYIQTYLERDVRSISSIRDLTTFRRFLSLVASRVGQILNRTDLAAPLGVSVPTISEWLNILEATHQIFLIPPYHENFGKRLVKSPKLYFADTGLASHLLGLENEKQLLKSPFFGPLFESFVAAEIVKAQMNSGRRRDLYFFRDRQGLEVDFLVPKKGGRLVLIEAKATRTVRPESAEALAKLRKAVKSDAVDAVLVHLPAATGPSPTAIRPGVRGATFRDIPAIVLGHKAFMNS